MSFFFLKKMQEDRAFFVTLRAIVEQRTREEIGDAPSPRFHDQLVDAPVPPVTKEILEEDFSQRLKTSARRSLISPNRRFECRGKHLTDVLVPPVTKEILDCSRTPLRNAFLAHVGAVRRRGREGDPG